MVHVTTLLHPPRSEGGQASAAREVEVASMIYVSHASSPPSSVDGLVSAGCCMVPDHSILSVATHSISPVMEGGNPEPQPPYPPASPLDDEFDSRAPQSTTHSCHLSAAEEDQYTDNEPSDFLKLAGCIYNQFGGAKGIRETRHDRAPGQGKENFIPQRR